MGHLSTSQLVSQGHKLDGTPADILPPNQNSTQEVGGSNHASLVNIGRTRVYLASANENIESSSDHTKENISYCPVNP